MIKRNIVANTVGRVWGVISVYLFVPLYLKYLGIEAYGLVGFYSTLMGVLAFADMGLTATLNREMARLAVRKESAGEMSDLLRTYETAYACISPLLAVLIWFLAPAISEHWLHSKTLQPHEISVAIRLMGIAVALQLPTGLYIGGLVGLQRQVLTNSLQITWGVVRGLGAVAVLWLFSRTIFAFAFWQVITNAVFCLAARFTLCRVLSSNIGHPKFDWLLFRRTWRYAAGMSALALTSTLLTQVDKLVVSKMMTLEMFGYYMVAGVMASVPVMLASPVALAVFPRLTGLVEAGDHAGLRRLYYQTCELVGAVIIPSGLTLALFAGEFMFAWTSSRLTAQQAGLTASLLVVGQMMQAVCVVPYYLALAHGSTKLVLINGIVSVFFVIPVLLYLIMKFGIVGAGMSWLLMNLLTLPVWAFLLHRQFLPGEFIRWCRRTLAPFLLAASPCILLGRWLMPHQSSRTVTFLMIALVWAVAAAACALSAPDLRKVLMRRSARLLGGSLVGAT